MSRAVVRETAYRLPDPEKRTWTHQDKKHPPLDLGAYLVRENIHALFPENWRRGMGVAYVEGGLYLTRGQKQVLLRELGASRLAENDDTRIAAIFIDKGYAFIIVQQGGTLHGHGLCTEGLAGITQGLQYGRQYTIRR